MDNKKRVLQGTKVVLSVFSVCTSCTLKAFFCWPSAMHLFFQAKRLNKKSVIHGILVIHAITTTVHCMSAETAIIVSRETLIFYHKSILVHFHWPHDPTITTHHPCHFNHHKTPISLRAAVVWQSLKQFRKILIVNSYLLKTLFKQINIVCIALFF